MTRYYFYKKESGVNTEKIKISNKGFSVSFWECNVFTPYPQGLEDYKKYFLFWWLLKQFHLFKNDDYFVCLLRKNNRVAHYSVVLPPHFRMPFLNNNDLQIGPVQTFPEFRRNGLAGIALNSIINEYGKVDREFWYITRKNNIPSIKSCEKAGFFRYAEGHKRKILKSNVLAIYKIDKIFE